MNSVAMERNTSAREAAEPTHTWTRASAAAGLISIVVSTVGYAMHGDFPMGKNGTGLVTWAAGTNQSSFAAGVYVEVVGFLFFTMFAAWLWAASRDAEGGSGWLSTAGFIGAVLLVGIAAVDDGIWVALLHAGRNGTNPQTLVVIRDIAQQLSVVSYLFEALFPLLIGYVLFVTKVAPRWIGLSAVILGLAIIVPPTAFIADLLFELWVLVVSIYLLIRPGGIVSPGGGLPSAR